jgi:hypothetical protein
LAEADVNCRVDPCLIWTFLQPVILFRPVRHKAAAAFDLKEIGTLPSKLHQTLQIVHLAKPAPEPSSLQRPIKSTAAPVPTLAGLLAGHGQPGIPAIPRSRRPRVMGPF